MAWLKWRGSKERGSWYAIWTEIAAGKPRKRFRSVGRSRAIAEKLKDEIERNLELKGVGLGQVVRLKQLRDDYLRLLEANGCQPSYLARVRVVLTHLERHYPGVKLPAITSNLLDDYKLRRRQERIDPATINRELGVIKAAVRKGRRWQYQVQDLSDVATVRGVEKVRGNFSREQLALMLERADTTFQVVIMLGLYAGLRRQEMTSLRWSDIDVSDKSIVLGSGWKTKSGKARAIPIHPNLYSELSKRRLEAKSDLVLNWMRSAHALSARFTYFLRRKCGIARGSLHTLRHTFLTALKRKDVDTGKVQRLAGHANERTTQGYVHLDVGDLRDGISRLDFNLDAAQKAD